MKDILKINSINIVRIHKSYDYKVSFNEDVTFLHGENGAGKTTVMNILSSIISGSFTELLNYSFDTITIDCSLGDEIKTIVIHDTEDMYRIVFFGKEIKIKKEFLHSISDGRYYPLKQVKDYLAFQKTIKNIFNCIYLPLNRVNQQIFSNEIVDYISKYDDELISTELRRNIRYSRDLQDNDKDMVKKALEVLKRNLERINNNKLEHYKEYSKDLASIGFDMIDPDEKIKLFSKSKMDVEHILDIYSQGIYTLEKEPHLDKIEKFKNQYLKLQENVNNLKSDSLLKFIVMSHDLLRYKKIADSIKKFNDEERIIAERKDTFVRILNSFLGLSPIYGKNIIISDSGDIMFRNICNDCITEIKPEQLSSGEMQLFVFFTHLIFEVPSSGGVFLVDEPELSLHINWQELLVGSILEANKNIQVIFATHSPDIISKKRDKLEKIGRIIHGEASKTLID